MKNAQDFDGGFFDPVEDEVISEQQAADSGMDFPADPAEKRVSNEFVRPEAQMINITIRSQFIMFGDELPNLDKVVFCGLRNLEFHPRRRLRPIALTSLETASSHSER